MLVKNFEKTDGRSQMGEAQKQIKLMIKEFYFRIKFDLFAPYQGLPACLGNTDCLE